MFKECNLGFSQALTTELGNASLVATAIGLVVVTPELVLIVILITLFLSAVKTP